MSDAITVDPGPQKFVNVAQCFHKFGELFEQPDKRDKLAERIHVAGTPTVIEEVPFADPDFQRLKRIQLAVELYAQECFGVNWTGKPVSFHKFAELFEKTTAMDQLVKRNKDPRGLLLTKLLVLVNAYARDVWGEDLMLMTGGVK